MEIIEADRQSQAKAESIQSIGRKWEYYESQNENTFLIDMLLCVIHNGRREYEVKNPEDNDTSWVKKSWFSEGVRISVNRGFQRESQPGRHGGEFTLKMIKALRREDGMTNAKPDRCYGLDSDLFASEDQNIFYLEELRLWLQVMTGMQHPFFLIEANQTTVT